MKFETPIAEVTKFNVQDVLTASTGSEPTEYSEETAAIYGIDNCGPL